MFAHSWKMHAAALAAMICSIAGTVLVEASPVDIAASKSRQSKMRDMGGDFKAINDELKKDKPDLENVIRPAAEGVKSRSAYLLNWFPKGSGPEAGVETHAKPEIWQHLDEFTKLGKAASAEASKLNDVAQGKDIPAIKAQYLATAKACKSCHDPYRVPSDDD